MLVTGKESIRAAGPTGGRTQEGYPVNVNTASQEVMAKVRRELAPERLPDKLKFFALLNAGLF